jgi:hypothetical protein
MAAIDQAARQHSHAVDARAEDRKQSRKQRDRREDRDRRDQHAADAHRADERQRQHDHREQADRDRRARDDDGAAGVGHGLDERRLDVVALTQLVAEPEDHQQCVVDRDAEADEGDQELHDDGDVGDVGQAPDERERVQDGRHRDHDRHQDRGQRPEHEQEDHQRAKPADHGFEEDARAPARAVRRCLLERVVAGHVDGDAGREAARRRGANPIRAALGAEVGLPGRVDLEEGRVAVVRDVHRVVRREVRARQRARHRRRSPLHCSLDRKAFRHVAVAVEDDDVRRPHTDAERLQRALARLVGRLPGDREALIPARRELARGDAAEQRQHDPDADHGPAMTGREVREAAEPPAVGSLDACRLNRRHGFPPSRRLGLTTAPPAKTNRRLLFVPESFANE